MKFWPSSTECPSLLSSKSGMVGASLVIIVGSEPF